MTAGALLRAFGPVVLALLAAGTFDRMTARRGFDPPGFAAPWRRGLAFLAIAGVLWAGVFLPLGEIGHVQHLDVAHIGLARLFLLHELMVGTILVWFLAGFAGLPRRRPAAAAQPPALPAEPAADEPAEQAARRLDDPLLVEPLLRPADGAISGQLDGGVLDPLADPLLAGGAAEPAAASLAGFQAPAPAAPAVEPSSPPAPPTPAPRPSLGRQLAAQLGLATASPGREVGVGIVLGAGAWLAVIVAVAVVASFIIYGLGAKGALPKQPPELIPWLAGLPFALRLLLALSAGVVEEAFFRGLLQPRIGIVLSTGMFILAHTAYGQPFLLLGVGILSIIYALIVRWRQNIWPAMAAHALFDGVQLLVIIPIALKMMGGHVPSTLAALL